MTLDYRLVKRFELSQHTVYQLFVRERGLRSEYVELLLSRDAADVAKVLQVTGGELLQTQLPKLTRFLILEEDGGRAARAAARRLPGGHLRPLHGRVRGPGPAPGRRGRPCIRAAGRGDRAAESDRGHRRPADRR